MQPASMGRRKEEEARQTEGRRGRALAVRKSRGASREEEEEERRPRGRQVGGGRGALDMRKERKGTDRKEGEGRWRREGKAVRPHRHRETRVAWPRRQREER